MKKLCIIGAGGLIGSEIIKKLNTTYEIYKLSGWILYEKPDSIAQKIEGSDYILNLAGHNIAGRWTKRKKELIRSSRVISTANLVRALVLLKEKPELYINASGISIYSDGYLADESAADFSDNFLAEVIKEWEIEVYNAHLAGVHTAIIRMGIVLSRNGGAYSKLRLITNFFLGGIIGNGKQGMSFIHIEDLVRALDFLMKNKLEGIINLCAPEPTTNAEFTRALAHELKRPAFFRVPSVFLKILLSGGHVMITSGQKAYPGVLLKHGFHFNYPDVYKSIRELEE